MGRYILDGMSFRTRKGGTENTLLYLTCVCIHGLSDQFSRGNAVDDHVEDMLAIYQTLANGFSSVTLMESGLKGAKVDSDRILQKRLNLSILLTLLLYTVKLADGLLIKDWS